LPGYRLQTQTTKFAFSMHFMPTALLFVVSAVVLAYLSGKVLLLCLRCRLPPLEDLSVACSVGLVASAFVFWIVTLLGGERLYFLWGLAVVGIYLWLPQPWSCKLSIFSSQSLSTQDEVSHDNLSGYLIAGLIAAGVLVLTLLPQYYTNLTLLRNGTMRVHPVYDVFFHLAIANELTHSIPPQAPLFAGSPLNYHYGMDLVVAMFADATGLSTIDLQLRFVSTLFLALSMLSAYCFARRILRSQYFGALAAFLVFFGEDFSFIPGILLGEKGDWSVRFFNVPSVLSLFYTNAMLPAIGLLFIGLLCLERYLQERNKSWMILSAIVFVALVEVKLFTAAHIMLCLGIGALVYLTLFRKTTLWKVAILTAILTLPLAFSVFLHNRTGAELVATFKPWPYVPIAMRMLDLKRLATSTPGIVGVGLPIYIIGCLGLRTIALPSILKSLLRPTYGSELRFLLALFVVSGAVITLTLQIVPEGAVHAYNNSVWFLAQSKYVAWLFAVEVLQNLARRLIGYGIAPMVATLLVALGAMALSLPSTFQHFALERNPYPIYGKAVMTEKTTAYSHEVLAITHYLARQAAPGDVVLTDETFLGPVLALTRCHVTLGYFSNYLVSAHDYAARRANERKFWQAWREGKVLDAPLRNAHVRYIVADDALEGAPGTLPSGISEVFSNSKGRVFRVR
jgi:hypothetical protein